MSRKAERVYRRCVGCGRGYWALARLLRKGEGRYCSPHCYRARSSRSVWLMCENCGRSFCRKPRARGAQSRFCSRLCWLDWRRHRTGAVSVTRHKCES